MRADIGGDSHIWYAISGRDGSILHICTLAFPTSGSANDDAWVRLLQCLGADLQVLALELGGVLWKVFVQGDFNFQPTSLGLGVDPSRKRREAWDIFIGKWNLALHNVCLNDEDPQPMLLPRRGREVEIRTGSTRHGPIVGRAIDLMLATEDLDVTMKIHNGIHCRQSSSIWVDEEGNLGLGCCGWD